MEQEGQSLPLIQVWNLLHLVDFILQHNKKEARYDHTGRSTGVWLIISEYI